MLLSRGGVYYFELQELTKSTTLNLHPTPPRWTAQVGAALVSQAPEKVHGVDKHNRERIDRSIE